MIVINIIGVKTSLSMVWPRGVHGGRIGTPYPSTTLEQFKAPTTGLEDILFTTGTNKDAANIIDTKKRLARYVGTCSYRGVAKSSLVIETMTEPTFTTNTRPTKPTLKKEGGVAVDDSVKEMLLLDYSIEVAKFIDNEKEARIEERDWKENGPKIWNLVLSHCPKQVILKLEAQPGYEVNALKRGPVELLEILQDFAQSFDATKTETMAIVESDMKLMMGY